MRESHLWIWTACCCAVAATAAYYHLAGGGGGDREAATMVVSGVAFDRAPPGAGTFAVTFEGNSFPETVEWSVEAALEGGRFPSLRLGGSSPLSGGGAYRSLTVVLPGDCESWKHATEIPGYSLTLSVSGKGKTHHADVTRLVHPGGR